MACEVWFYHLERSGLDQVLPELLDKTLQKGWKAVVRSSSTERIDHLDSFLWSYRDEAFLPHGRADEPQAERQPVLLTTGQDNPAGAEALFLIDGAEPGMIDNYSRCMVLFDGRDEDALTLARQRWKAFKAQDVVMAYWKQGEQRGWERQA
jgi:DNA polymerase-3 subunit chi